MTIVLTFLVAVLAGTALRLGTGSAWFVFGALACLGGIAVRVCTFSHEDITGPGPRRPR